MLASIWFHMAVIDLFRPFADQQPQPVLGHFAAVQGIPASVIESSIQQLKRLIYQYRHNCEAAKYSIIWQSGLLYLVNHILQHLSTREAQFYFLLCMRGYQQLARHVSTITGIVQSIFAMAIRRGVVLSAEEPRRLLREVQDESWHSLKFYSAYPVDLQLALQGRPASTVEYVTELLQDVTMVGEKCETDVQVAAQVAAGCKGTVESKKETVALGDDCISKSCTYFHTSIC